MAGGILITTYDTVRTSWQLLSGSQENGERISWDYIFADEGHFLKNPVSERAVALNRIAADHKIIITGTPIQNNLQELRALFEFCCPFLLNNKTWFKDRFEDPICRGNVRMASNLQQEAGSRAAKKLQRLIKPYLLRRLKKDVLVLPKKTELTIWLKLSECQKKLYKEICESRELRIRPSYAKINDLRKICDHPKIYKKSLEAGNEDSCKIKFILLLLENLIIEDHRVLVFSTRLKMLDIIQAAITVKGYSFSRIDGKVKVDDRDRIIQEFQAGNYQILLLTSQVAGFGLTLTAADRVLVVSPDWNPSTDRQIVDRAYRFGQKRDVIVYRLFTCGTVEEAAYKKQALKTTLAKTVAKGKHQDCGFGVADFKGVLSVKEEHFLFSVTQRKLEELHRKHGNPRQLDESVRMHLSFLQRNHIEVGFYDLPIS